MNLLHFAAFRAVMLTGTVSGAAQLIGRSQPAVSRLIDKLEQELGLSLFERRKGLITPTTVAHSLLDEVERAYVSLDSLRSFSSRLARSGGGEISIAAMPALGGGILPQLLARFRKEWPETKVVLHIGQSAKIEELAASQQIDFGFAERPFRRSGFRAEVFSDSPYVAAVPAHHPLADRARIEPGDLEAGPFISWTSLVSTRPLVDQVLQANGVRVEAAYETTYSFSALEMVRGGIGIAIIDPYTAAIRQDDRIRLIPFVPTIPFSVALLRPDSRPVTPAMDALLEMMLEDRDLALASLPG